MRALVLILKLNVLLASLDFTELLAGTWSVLLLTKCEIQSLAYFCVVNENRLWSFHMLVC